MNNYYEQLFRDHPLVCAFVLGNYEVELEKKGEIERLRPSEFARMLDSGELSSEVNFFDPKNIESMEGDMMARLVKYIQADIDPDKEYNAIEQESLNKYLDAMIIGPIEKDENPFHHMLDFGYTVEDGVLRIQWIRIKGELSAN